MTLPKSPILPLAVFAVIAMVHTPLHADTKKTCGGWQPGDYDVTDEDGTKWKCKNHRSCVIKETGTCQQIFGCHTTFVEEFGDCKKASANVGTTKRPEALHQGKDKPKAAQ